MRTTHSFSIEFLKRSCRGKKKKGKAHIYARIWVDGEAAEISLKEEVNEKDWDPQAEQVKGRSIQAKSLNDHIDDVRDKIRNKYRVLQQAEVLITAESDSRPTLSTISEPIPLIRISLATETASPSIFKDLSESSRGQKTM